MHPEHPPMVSDAFLRDFRGLMAKYPVPSRYSKNQEGARDSGHYNSRFRRQGASDKRMIRAIALDGVAGFPDEENGTPLDPDTIDKVIQLLHESDIDEDTAAAIAQILRQASPEAGAQDEADELDDGNPNPNRNINGRGSKAFDKGYPSNTCTYPGGPRFEGAPRPGGTMIPMRPGGNGVRMTEMAGDTAMNDFLSMFPQARGIGLDPNALLPRSHPLTPSSVRSVARTNRAASGMAMDSSGDDSYDRMFPGVRGRIGLL